MAYDAHAFRARAVHTDRPTLATAAHMDWSAELRRLHELRHGREVLLHWCRAVEIQHFPPHFDRMPELPGVLPPVRVAACVAANCARCEAGRGGFQFPWIGTFTRRDVLVEAGIPPQVAWARVSACSECLSVEEVRQASSGLTVDDVAPSHINRLVAVLADQQERGNPRLATADDLWQVWRIWQQGERRWREPAYEPVAGRETAIRDPVARAGRALWFWLGSVGAGLENLYSPCAACGFATVLLCHICHRFVCFDCTRPALALLGAGLVLPSGTSVQTMDKDGLGSGPQALGGEGPQARPSFGWLVGELPMASAWTRTLPLLSAVWRKRLEMRVQKWPWLGSRLGHARPRGTACHAAALAGRQVSQASRPPLPRRCKPVPLHGRVRQQAAVGPPKEGITTAMIDELSAFLVDARCRRPRGELTYARQAEWEISVKRLVQNHAATAEAATFKNAIKTLQELYHFQILRGRAQGLEEVDPVDLDAFLHGGATAPTRGLQALRWISKNAQLQWELPELRRVKQPKAVGEQQAMVVEPPLLSHLEDRISAMCKAGDARWTALLGQWLVGVGVLRYKHLNLSTVLKITPSTVHCFCTKGKQAKLRQGFYWCVPATFSNRFAWTKPWVDQFLLLSPARRKHCGLVFDMRGRPLVRA